MKIKDIIDQFIAGDWGEETYSDKTPCAVTCVRGADIIPISEHNFSEIPIRYISQQSYSRKCLQVGDIIIEKSGGSPTQSTGRVSFISKELLDSVGPVVCSNFCVAFRVKNGWNPLYVYYYFQFLYNRGVFFNFEGKTSGLKNFQLDAAFAAISIEDVSESTQNNIVAVLQGLERKITINRQINQNLEAMAKQLYNYWFVQFDFPDENGRPYKSSGGEMVWNETLKREIPEGWEVKPLNNRLEIKSGFPFKSDTYKTFGRYKIVTIKNVQDGELVTSGCDYIDEIPNRANDYISLKIGDRLISLTGNCGRLCVVCEENLLLNQRVGLLYCDARYLEYFYNFLNSNVMRTVVENLANGAAQANLSPVELCKTNCFIPPKDILVMYNKKANTIRKAIIQNKREISLLTKQRDQLLPLLMNGQASVG